MTGPLVSVITPTWQRHDLLLSRCIPSVAAQDYPHVEHVVVSDGPDDELEQILYADHPDVVFRQLATHDPQFRWGHRARLHGIEAASGDVIAWLDDDNSYRPQHLSRLVPMLETADFAYSVVLFHNHGGSYPVGVDPPMYCNIDTSALVHRRDLLDRATWRDEGQPSNDWDLVERWIGAGATWGFDPLPTADYYFRDVPDA